MIIDIGVVAGMELDKSELLPLMQTIIGCGMGIPNEQNRSGFGFKPDGESFTDRLT